MWARPCSSAPARWTRSRRERWTVTAHILRAGVGAALNNVNVRKKGKPDIKAPITARGDELAKQLNLNNNDILNQHPQARERVRHLVNLYESVFTDKDVAVGHTELVKMDIKLVKEANLFGLWSGTSSPP